VRINSFLGWRGAPGGPRGGRCCRRGGARAHGVARRRARPGLARCGWPCPCCCAASGVLAEGPLAATAMRTLGSHAWRPCARGPDLPPPCCRGLTTGCKSASVSYGSKSSARGSVICHYKVSYVLSITLRSPSDHTHQPLRKPAVNLPDCDPRDVTRVRASCECRADLHAPCLPDTCMRHACLIPACPAQSALGACPRA